MRKSEIVLINHQGLKLSSGLQIQSPSPPIGLAYVGSYIKKNGFDYTAIDACGEALSQVRESLHSSDILIQGLSIKEIINNIPKEVKIVGLTSLFSHAWFLVKEIAVEIKKSFPNCIISVGGEHATAVPDNTLKNDCIDLVILGEGEETFLNLLNNIKNGLDYTTVKGIGYKDVNGNIIINERRKRTIKIDEIPFPDWDSWSINNYINHFQVTGVNLGRGIPILGSRGCPYECTFCSNPLMWTKRYIMRSPKSIVDEMEKMKEKYNVSVFHFMDSTFLINTKKLIEFCEELINRNLNVSYQLPAGTRSEAITEELVYALERSGLKQLSLAPESGSEEIRNIIKKKINFDKFFNAVKILNKSKISVGCYIVIGFPEDNIKTLMQSLKLIIKLAILGVDDITVSQFTPYPGSYYYDMLTEKGVLKDNLENVSEIVSFYYQRKQSFSPNLSPRTTFFAMIFMFLTFYLTSFLVRPWRLFFNLFSYFYFGIEKAKYIKFLSEISYTRKKFKSSIVKSE